MQNEPDRESLKTDGGDLITSSVTDGKDCKDCQRIIKDSSLEEFQDPWVDLFLKSPWKSWRWWCDTPAPWRWWCDTPALSHYDTLALLHYFAQCSCTLALLCTLVLPCTTLRSCTVSRWREGENGTKIKRERNATSILRTRQIFGPRFIFSNKYGFCQMQIPSGEYLQLRIRPCNGQGFKNLNQCSHNVGFKRVAQRG